MVFGFKRIFERRAFKAHRAAMTFASLAAAVPALGCDVVVDTSSEQCKTDRDCTAKGAEFANTFCTPQKVCGQLRCTSSSECTAQLGEPGYCRPSGTCTRVLSAPNEDGTRDCYDVVPKDVLSQDQVFLAGFMAPLRKGDLDASYGEPLLQGAALALEDIRALNGFPGIDGPARRQLGMVVCHDNQNAVGVAHHLVDQVRVPAIIGPAFSQNTIDVTTGVTIPAGVLTISASATSPRITGLDDRDLVWRTAPSDVIQATALALLLKATEALLRNEGLPASDKLRVAYAVRGDSYGDGISNAFIDKVAKLGIKQSSEISAFTVVRYDPDPTHVDDKGWEAYATSIAQSKPHLIFGFGTAEFAKNLLPKIEQLWDSSVARPRYLVPEGTRLPELAATVKASPELRTRILGTAPGARKSARWPNFQKNFQAHFGVAEPGNLAEFAYDAAYLLAYAIGTTRQQWPNGTELAAGLAKMSCSPGQQIAADSESFSQSFVTATNAACIDFDGVSGPLDFDSHGEAASDIALWCPDPASEQFPLLATYYDATAGRLVSGTDVDPLTQGVAFCE